MSNELSNVAYKKGNLLRYSLWALGATCVAILFSTVLNLLNGEISAVVPDGYKFSVTDNYVESSRVRTTYYVYHDDRIFVEDESFESDAVNRVVMVYDNVSTYGLTLDKDDVVEYCELGSCNMKPKVLVTIKNLISRSIGREYLGI